MKKVVSLLLFFLFVQTVVSQKVSYSGEAFGACEAVEASVSKNKFSVYISQHELREGYGGKFELSGGRLNVDNNNKVPSNLELLMEVEFVNGLKFPITPKDSVYINLSALNKGYRDDMSMMSQINSKDHARVEKERKDFQGKKNGMQEKMKALTKKFQEGKISADEFGKKLKALSDPLLKEAQSSYTNSIRFTEAEDATTYSIDFINTYKLIESRAFSGTLYIERFNEKEFVASFNGIQMVDCLEKRAASSKEEEKKCKSHRSKYMKEFFVFKEGEVKGTINVKLKKFEDFR